MARPRILKAGQRPAAEPLPYPPVIVVWVDAESHAGDYELEEVVKHPLPVRRSIGFLVRKTRAEITLVGTDDRFAKGVEKEMIGDALRVPMGMVQKIVYLREDPRARKV